MIRAFALVLAFSLACSPADTTAECNELQDDFSRCVGSGLGRLDCHAVAPADVERLSEYTRGASCEVIASALPGDGDLLSATCRVLGVGCVDAVTAAPENQPARYPFVLVNGIDNSPLFRWNDRIVRMMQERGGQRVFVATLPPFSPPRVRVPQLWKRIGEVLRATGAERVNLICHSLGGLDCRYLVSPGGYVLDHAEVDPSVVASITTVGTAHRGTRVADSALGLGPQGEQARVLDDLASLAGDWFGNEPLASDAVLRDALRALSVAEAPAFNAVITDRDDLFYQSWAGYSRPFGKATPTHDLALREACRLDDQHDGLPDFRAHDYMALALAPFSDLAGRTDDGSLEPNDGLTAVSSARWGEFRGCIPADHMEQLGAQNLPDVNVRTGFDVARFYTNVAADLAERGF